MSENNPYSSESLGLVPESPSVVNNPYSSEALGQTAPSALKQSMYVGVQKNPDEYAKVLNIADKMKVPSDLVESDYSAFKQAEDLKSLDPSTLQRSFPKMSAWLENPDNAGIAHDDILTLKRMSSAIEGYSFASDLYNKFNSGIASLGKSVAQIPAAAGQALALPYNLALGAQGELTGRPDLYEPYKFQYPKEGILLDNPVTRYFDRRSKEYAEMATEKTVSNEELFQSIEDGDYKTAGRQFAYKLVETLPTTLGIVAGSLGGYGTAAAAIGAATSGAQASAEGLEAGVGPVAQTTNAISNAAFEFIGEKIFTVLPIEAITKKYGQSVANVVFKEAALVFAKQGVLEAAGEGLTQAGQSVSSYLTGVNPGALDTLMQDILVSASLGGATGAGISAPGAILTGLQSVDRKVDRERRASNSAETYTEIGQAAAESKLRQRSPERFESYLETQTNGTENESIYISPESFETYFQSKDENPLEVLQKLDAIEAYDTAKETGTDIKIPTSKWTARLNQEDYNGLKDDIKYQPDHSSVNETKLLREEVQAVADEAQAPTPVEQSAAEVKRIVKEQLIAAGTDPTVAEEQAKITESRVTQRANLLGVDPQELYKNQNVTIQAGTTPAITTPEEHVLNQAEIIDFGVFKKQKELQKELQEEAALREPSETPLPPLERLKARFGNDKIALKAIDKAQKNNGSSYVADKKIKGLGFAPNYLAEPTGVIGNPEIQGLNNDGKDIDPLSWLDSKYKATQQLIQKHAEKGIPLTINTSSDLIGANDYIESLPQGTTVNFYVTPENGEIVRDGSAFSFNREVFKALPSRQRQFIAIEKLKEAGVNVNIIEPTADSVIQFAGGIKKLSKTLNLSEAEAMAEVRKATDPLLLKKFGDEKQTFFQKDSENTFNAVTPEEFIKARDQSKRAQFLTPYTAEELKDYQLFLTPDGVGYALSPDLDMIGVFNNSDKPGAAREAIVDGISRGAKTLDALDGFLPKYYNGFGFVEEKRITWDDKYAPRGWNYEKYDRPDVVFLKYPESLSREQGAVRSRTELARRQLGESSDQGRQSNVFPERDGRIDWEEWGRLGQEEQDAALRRAGVSSEPVIANQDDSGSIKGQIQLSRNKKIISLFKSADPSTFLHESGHLYLDEIKEDTEALKARDPATLTPAQSRFLEDSQAILDFLDVKSFDEIGEPQQEKWARSFEQYLMEGKAPSQKLRKAFKSFKNWLTKIYKSLVPGSQINPEIRAIFDRLLASEQEIADAQAAQNQAPIFTTQEASGMNDEQWAKYQEAVMEARQFAEETITNEVMEDLRKRQRKEYKERRAQIEKQARAEANASPVYRALSILQKGELPDGSPLPEGQYPIKLSKAEINSEYISGAPKGIFNEKTGVPADMAAEILGFQSGDDLLQSISNAEPKEEFIKRITDETMQSLYPDLLGTPQFSEEAMKAVHNDSRERMLRMELERLAEVNMPLLKQLGKRISRRIPSKEALRAQAMEVIGKQNVGDISPRVYELAERKQAKLAGELFFKGDIAGAFEAKRKEALNHALYREAVEARDLITKSAKQFRKISRMTDEKAVSLRRDSNLVNAAKSIIANFGLGTKTAKTAEQYLSPIKAYDPEAYATLKDMVESVNIDPTPYKQLSFNEFKQVSESVNSLWALSKSTQEVFLDGKKIDKQVALDMLQAQTDEALKLNVQKDREYDETMSRLDRIKNFALSYFSWTRSVESWVDAMDLGDINGTFRKLIFDPVIEGVAAYKKQKAVYSKRVLDILQPVLKDTSFKEIIATERPGKPFKFKGKQELLGALMHRGNDSNFSKFIRGEGWGAFNPDGSLDTAAWDQFEARMRREGVLTKADYDAIQQVWDLYEELKPELQKAHYKRYGRYFNEVTANSFTNEFGTYRGGYAPARIDSQRVQRQEILDDKNIMERLNNSYAWPTTGSGSTQTRNEEYAAPLLLDLRAINSHLDWALRFAHLQNPVMDVARLVYSETFEKMIGAFDPNAVREMLKPWLQRSAQQLVSVPSDNTLMRSIDSLSKYVRQSTTMQFLSLNIINAAQNFTGIGPALLKVKAKYLKNAFVAYVKQPKAFAEEIANKSDFMSDLLKEEIAETAGEIEALISDQKAVGKAQDLARQFGQVLQRLTQNQLNVLVWSGAYNQSIDQGMSDKDAIRSADSAVRQTQAVGGAENMTRLETYTETAKLITMFTRYFISMLNLNTTEAVKVNRTTVGKMAKTPLLMNIYLLGFFVPSVVAEGIRRGLSGDDLDADDDDEYLDDLADIFLFSQARFATAMIPGGGTVINSVLNYFDDKYYNDSITVSPALSAVQSAARAPKDIYDIALGEDVKKQDVRDILTLMGIVTKLPLLPLARPIGYLMDVESGKADPSGPIDFTRGLVTGKSGGGR
jgi:hypothetical protein